ncbi:c-type cytochrome domain-containing protein [Winogradskyella immobilis]|uniref:Cytochrome C Planctomycete-type domain-containing protein n=1 Tax=Winogradskyella immobilis TaxID=2816852 RepID=A0ABS8EK47_9FLAO|nr:c-type cytochrome domain-containing protein [Winogradskyella immobilis]MCC1483573.1 hypothetical protein [Winogradskyella immobilis]MCG0015667.1 hypothetical protein [Winogradskyella immobilis]
MNYKATIKKKSFYIGLLYLLMSTMVLVGCETSTLSELAESEEEPDPDPIALVTYDNTAKAILDNACIECHNTVIPTAGIILDSFETARAVAESGRMIARMTSTNNPMPPSGNLPNSIIEDIMDWIDDGLLEN